MSKDSVLYNVEVVTSSDRQKKDVKSEAKLTAQGLLENLNLALDNHLVVAGKIPVPLDDMLESNEKITIYETVSGG